MNASILASLLAVVASAASSGTSSPLSKLSALQDISESCSPSGVIQDACCEYKTIEQVNNEIAPYLDDLVKTSFFRYVKIDLNRGCNFWKEDGLCIQEGCAVEPASENDLPKELRSSTLSSVDYSLSNDASFPIFNKKCQFNENDFCVIDDPNVLQDIPYVNLLKNPERFTGYAGDSAARVWGAIYKENCFDGGVGDNVAKEGGGLSGLLRQGMDKVGGDGGDVCMEKRVFYRLVSGLHSSISTHICDQFLNQKTGKWERNLDCFKYRLGKFPDRIQNMYFTYVVLLRAITKLSPYLESNSWCSSASDKKRIASLVKGIVEKTLSCPPTFDESVMFTDHATQSLKEEFKNHFRNISLIMDCVGCEKCRLWGKIQITGLGTALKILFSFGDDPSQYRLTRTELVSLINGFNRISNSLRAVERFRGRIKDQEAVLLELTSASSSSSSSSASFSSSAASSASESASSSTTNSVKDAGIQKPIIDLSYTDFNDPKKIVKWGIGLLITVVGFVSIVYKGYQNHVGTYKVSESAKEVSDASFANNGNKLGDEVENTSGVFVKEKEKPGSPRKEGVKKRTNNKKK
ncbi:hypothetical protein BDR26DRAFT_865804 [Obelidium mucronatum]|nr:hypothetical protein BDR26DRAFT_865804 [Obelidium mucronatum]